MTDDNFWPGPGKFDLEVVGESHYQKNLKKIAGPNSDDGVRMECRATLVLERDNPKDPNAVRVDVHDLTVGYLKSTEAPAIRATLKASGIKPGQSVECMAVIAGGRTDQQYGVWLDVPVVRGSPPKKPWWRFW